VGKKKKKNQSQSKKKKILFFSCPIWCWWQPVAWIRNLRGKKKKKKKKKKNTFPFKGGAFSPGGGLPFSRENFLVIREKIRKKRKKNKLGGRFPFPRRGGENEGGGRFRDGWGGQKNLFSPPSGPSPPGPGKVGNPSPPFLGAGVGWAWGGWGRFF